MENQDKKQELSVYEFFAKFPNEETARNHFENQRWRNGVECSHCNSKNIQECKDHKPMAYRCRDCRKHFSVRTNTILSESKLPLQKWLLAMYILTTSKKGISSIQLAKHLGCTQKTAWFLAHRIRKTWEQNKDKLNGTVEIDETYMGGKEANKHANKKLKAGRGAVGKTAVFGILERKGEVKAMVVKKTDSKTLHKGIKENVEAESVVYTDCYKSYNKLTGFKHQKVKHSVGEYVRGQAHTNGIESFWALLKRGYYGIYHHMSSKHLQRYVNEFATRFNNNSLDTITVINNSINAGLGLRLTYKDLRNA